MKSGRARRISRPKTPRDQRPIAQSNGPGSQWASATTAHAVAVGMRKPPRRSSPRTMPRTTFAVGSPFGPGGGRHGRADRHGGELALGPAGARRPDPDARPAELVAQALDQAVDGVLARDVGRRVRQADEPQGRRDLDDLPRTAPSHRPDGLLGQVHERHQVDLDDAADLLGVLLGEVVVVPQARVVDQQVDAPREGLGPLPEPRRKSGSARSPSTTTTRPSGSSAASDSRRSSRRAVASTVIPRSRTSWRTSSRPRPDDAPVTRA